MNAIPTFQTSFPNAISANTTATFSTCAPSAVELG
jgi:hypothetical protein